MWKQASQAETQTCKKSRVDANLPLICVQILTITAGEQSFPTSTGLRSRFPWRLGADAATASPAVLNHPATLRLIHRKPPQARRASSCARCICPICGGATHEYFIPLRLRAAAQQSYGQRKLSKHCATQFFFQSPSTESWLQG